MANNKNMARQRRYAVRAYWCVLDSVLLFAGGRIPISVRTPFGFNRLAGRFDTRSYLLWGGQTSDMLPLVAVVAYVASMAAEGSMPQKSRYKGLLPCRRAISGRSWNSTRRSSAAAGAARARW